MSKTITVLYSIDALIELQANIGKKTKLYLRNLLEYSLKKKSPIKVRNGNPPDTFVEEGSQQAFPGCFN